MRYCDCCNKERVVMVSLHKVLDALNLVKRKFDIVTCKKCQHSFINPMPLNLQGITNFYPKGYYAHNVFVYPKCSVKAKLKLFLIKLYYAQYSRNKFIRLLEKLLYLFVKHTINEPPVVTNGKLLDIGCGNGEYLSIVRRFGWDTYGIELNEKAVYIAQSVGLRVKKGSAEDTGYEAGFFDVVRMWNALEHVISPRRALLEATRVLKKRGYLLVYVPNFNSLDRKYFGKYWASLEVPRHLHHFSAKSLESYLEKAGTVIERRMYPGTIFSMLDPTIKIMRGDKMTVFSIAIRVTAVIVGKIYNRLLGRYSGDVGITLLTRKV